jgi:hypothetical protein
MSRARLLVLAALAGGAAAVSLGACKSDNKPKATTVASASADPFKIDDEDVPVSVDYEEEALKSITPDNVEEEVAKMEKELE